MAEEIDKALIDLYPELLSEQREEAQYHLQQYLEVVYRIYEELEEQGILEEELLKEQLHQEWEKRSKN